METLSAAGDELASRTAGGTELSWCRAVPGGTGITVLAVHLARQIPPPLLRTFLRRLQLSHPILRARLPSASSVNPQTPIAISPSPSDEIEVIAPERLPQIAVAGDPPPLSLFHSVVERELNRNSWDGPAEDGPVGSFFATVYEVPEADSSFLVLRFHTGICDRTSGTAILKDLFDYVAGGGDWEVGDGAERGEEGEVLLALEDLIRKEDAWKPFWARGKDLLGYSLNGLRTSCLRFNDAGSDRQSEAVRLVLEVEATSRLLAVCDSKGVKLCSAITAAGILAAHASKNHQNYQSETYSIITLVDCRKYLNPPLDNKHIGFYHSAILNTHTIYGNEVFWDMTNKCFDAFSNAKNNKKHLSDIGDLNFLMCKAIENPHLTPSSSLRTALISIFEDVVDYDVAFGQLQGTGIEDYLLCASVHGIGASMAVFETIRNGQLDCTCVYPSPLHSRKQMMELVDSMKSILEGSCAVEEEGK